MRLTIKQHTISSSIKNSETGTALILEKENTYEKDFGD